MAVTVCLGGFACVSTEDRHHGQADGANSLSAQTLLADFREAARANSVEATLVVDPHGVSHVLAANEDAAFFSQGFVHAHSRLWQMESRSRMVEGSHAALRGEDSVYSDEWSLYLRADQIAKRSFKKMLADDVTKNAIQAYVRGVNAFIHHLGEKGLPAEYLEAGLRPRLFRDVDVANISLQLAWSSLDIHDEVRLTRTFHRLGADRFSKLFPLDGFQSEPRFSGLESRGPFQKKADSGFRGVAQIAEHETPVKLRRNSWLYRSTGTGSNSWVNRPKKKAPILANDFHNSLRLPADYIPMQLTTPSFNVLGATSPGVPGVLTGTNGRVAWSSVSSLIDAGDWYRLEFKDPQQATYRWNGGWHDVQGEQVEIKVRNGPSRTLLRKRTQAGPLVPAIQIDETGRTEGFVYRWAGEEGVNFLGASLRRLKSVQAKDCGAEEFLSSAPHILLTCLDIDGKAGSWVMGNFPKRPTKHDPRLVARATDTSSLWQGYLGSGFNPRVYPAHGEVVATNQRLHTSAKGLYLGWQFEGVYRARRLEVLMRERPPQTPFDALALQSDVISQRILDSKPLLLKTVVSAEKTYNCDSDFQKQLAEWNGDYSKSREAAGFYSHWLSQINYMIWDHTIGPEHAFRWPVSSLVTDLLADKEKEAIAALDLNEAVVGREREKVVAEAYRISCQKPRSYSAQPVFFLHAPSVFSRFSAPEVAGSGATVFTQAEDLGVTYRFVTVLEERPRFWFAAPGGAGSQPGDRFFKKGMETWAKRETVEVPFLRKEDYK
ncbi:MAG: penicillin acylase family protein [Bdellovibrionales bacterium]|jgi:penicillin amidase|nr:penicillin acylase family protein [Bdellovibrionales bacterium]